MNVLQPQMIQELTERKGREGSPVLSIYLNLDPTNLLNRRSGYKVALDGMLKDLESQIEDEEKLRHFKADAEWVSQKVEFHLPKGKSLLLFSDVSESFFFEEDLPIRMANQAWFGDTPYIRPILEARDEYERYGVVVVDRESARFFVITMGSIEEVSNVFQTPPFKHRASSGRDQMRSSQAVSQRRAATWSGWFLKDVSDILQDIIQKYDIDRVLLGGPEETAAELQRLFPKVTASRVVDKVKVSVNAKTGEVFDLCLPIIERIEREQELDMVSDLVTIAKKTKPTMQKAVLGLNATLDAVNQGRVYRLFYPSGVKMIGYQCASCNVLLDHSPADGKCPYCSQPLEEVDDIIWLASERVLAMGGKAEEIKGDEARVQLDAAGGVGAFLR